MPAPPSPWPAGSAAWRCPPDELQSRGCFRTWPADGTRAPLATDLLLHEQADPEAAREDGARLAQVIEQAARRWKLPLALPLMDLRLDKADLLASLGVDTMDAADRFHFSRAARRGGPRRTCEVASASRCAGSQARDEALRLIASTTDLVPIGMVIGPFSLATKLMADPITAGRAPGLGRRARRRAPGPPAAGLPGGRRERGSGPRPNGSLKPEPGPFWSASRPPTRRSSHLARFVPGPPSSSVW